MVKALSSRPYASSLCIVYASSMHRPYAPSLCTVYASSLHRLFVWIRPYHSLIYFPVRRDLLPLSSTDLFPLGLVHGREGALSNNHQSTEGKMPKRTGTDWY